MTFTNNSIDLVMDDIGDLGELPMWSDEGLMPFIVMTDYQNVSPYTFEETQKYV